MDDGLAVLVQVVEGIGHISEYGDEGSGAGRILFLVGSSEVHVHQFRKNDGHVPASLHCIVKHSSHKPDQVGMLDTVYSDMHVYS